MSETRNLPTLAELHHAPELAYQTDKFNLLMSQQPHDTWLKKHPYINGGAYKYLPVDKVEFLLTRIFGGYQVEVKQVQQLFNSVCVTIRLHVRHPVTGEMIFQDGVGAASMQTDKGAGAADLGAIKDAAVVIGAPKAKSQAIKDAAEQLGAIFGKDLNKKDIFPFQGAYAPDMATTSTPQPTTVIPNINTPF